MKSCSSLLGVSFGSWPSGMISPALPLCSSPSIMLANSLEGNTAASVSSKSESPLPRLDKISATLEMPKSLDHPSPQPIPEGECTTTTTTTHSSGCVQPLRQFGRVQVGCCFALRTLEQLIFFGNTSEAAAWMCATLRQRFPVSVALIVALVSVFGALCRGCWTQPSDSFSISVALISHKHVHLSGGF